MNIIENLKSRNFKKLHTDKKPYNVFNYLTEEEIKYFENKGKELSNTEWMTKCIDLDILFTIFKKEHDKHKS